MKQHACIYLAGLDGICNEIVSTRIITKNFSSFDMKATVLSKLRTSKPSTGEYYFEVVLIIAFPISAAAAVPMPTSNPPRPLFVRMVHTSTLTPVACSGRLSPQHSSLEKFLPVSFYGSVISLVCTRQAVLPLDDILLSC